LCGHAIGVLTGGCLVFGLSSQTPPALLTYLRTLPFLRDRLLDSWAGDSETTMTLSLVNDDNNDQ
jgi:hypothetical protein